MELTMFERLLQLPLFQGMTTQEVSDVISHVRLDFANYHRGDEIVMQGESCRKLIYIISGEVMAEHRNASLQLLLTEHLPDLKVRQACTAQSSHDKQHCQNQLHEHRLQQIPTDRTVALPLS